MPRAVDPQSPRVEKRCTPCPPDGWISSPLIAQSTHSTAVSLSGSGSLLSLCSLGAESVVVRPTPSRFGWLVHDMVGFLAVFFMLSHLTHTIH